MESWWPHLRALQNTGHDARFSDDYTLEVGEYRIRPSEDNLYDLWSVEDDDFCSSHKSLHDALAALRIHLKHLDVKSYCDHVPDVFYVNPDGSMERMEDEDSYRPTIYFNGKEWVGLSLDGKRFRDQDVRNVVNSIVDSSSGCNDWSLYVANIERIKADLTSAFDESIRQLTSFRERSTRPRFIRFENGRWSESVASSGRTIRFHQASGEWVLSEDNEPMDANKDLKKLL